MRLAEELANKWLWEVHSPHQWYEIFEGQVDLDNQKLHANVVEAINEAIERCAQLAESIEKRPDYAGEVYELARHETAQDLARAIRTLKGMPVVRTKA